MTKTDRRIEELTDEIRELRKEVQRLRPVGIPVPYPAYPFNPWFVPYSQPIHPSQPVWIAPPYTITVGGTYGDVLNGTATITNTTSPSTSGFVSYEDATRHAAAVSYTVE